MMGRSYIKKVWILFFVLVLFAVTHTCAQAPQLQTFTDKTDILIGEQIQYKVVATYDTSLFRLHWLNIPDSLPHFDVVERGKIDTSVDNNKNTIVQQTFTITSFDSGRWNTPPLAVQFEKNQNNNNPINLLTDSIAINVGYAPADSTNQLRDIKPIMEVTVTSYLWYYIGGAALLLVIALFFLVRYLKNRKKNADPVFSSRTNPYDEALQELEKLRTYNLTDDESIKKYHARLAEIFKWYISRKQRFSVMNKTTGDVLVHLSNNNLPAEVISSTATALRCGDAVKFAKYLPAVAESEDCMARIKNTILFIKQQTDNKPV
ncbi:MAG: hypothetical protein JST86_07190 [Bacteroidetes bacterium]|nr:hypothetical protein [Bacteroidota bacterium]